MFWLLFIAAILTVLCTSVTIMWMTVNRIKPELGTRMKTCFGLYGDKQPLYKYVVTPVQREQFQQGIPKVDSCPVHVQPSAENLDLRLLTELNKPTDPYETSERHSTQENDECGNIEVPETDQTSRSYQECQKDDASWVRHVKSSIEEKNSSPELENMTLTTKRQQPDTEVPNGPSEATAKVIEPMLSFSIFYDTSSKDLHVTILHATSLQNDDVTNREGHAHYFRVHVRVEPWETEWRGSRLVSGRTGTSFGETFIASGLVHHKLRECHIHFVLIQLEEHKHCWKVVGELTQSLIECRANHLMKITKKLTRVQP